MQDKKYNEFKEDKIIKIRAVLNKILYPKFGLGEENNTLGIVSWVIAEVLEGKPASNSFGEVTIKGEYSTGVRDGREYIIIGREVTHPTYGKQYELIYYNEDYDFTKASNQRAFLRTFMTENQVEEFYKTFDNPLEVIERGDKEELKKVHGVGDYISNRILEDFEQKRDLSQIYLELDGMGITSNLIKKLIQVYKTPQKAIQMVKEKPYELVKDIDGVGFLKADAIASCGGFGPKDVRRIKAFIIWFLREQGNEGHSYITAKELIENIYSTLGSEKEIVEKYNVEVGQPDNNIKKAIAELEAENTIVVEGNEKKALRKIYLLKYYELERDIAYHLKRLLRAHNEFKVDNFDEAVAQAENEQGFTYTDEQKKGIRLAVESQVCIISGYAGAGKSSLIKGVLTVLNKYTFAQTALSGKAAARLQEVTGVEGYTIHRLLEFAGNGFGRNKDNQLPYKIIVLDEISMVGGELFLSLIEAIPTGSKLIMAGDMGQLESLGLLNLAADMINSKEIPVVELKTVHRQAKASGILSTAYDIRNQYQLYTESNYCGIETVGELQDMVIDVSPDKDEDREKAVRYFMKYLDSSLVGHDLEKIQIVTTVRERGECCVFNLNQDIQELINPVDGSKAAVLVKKKKNAQGKDFSFYLQVKDKIMCIKNNYHLFDENEVETSIFNGWTGEITDIDSRFVHVKFDLYKPAPILLPKTRIGEYLTLGYASTCHKCQRSGFDVVICILDYSAPPSMLTHQMAYTMLTRAKKKCVLIAQTRALSKAIATDFISTKRTFLPMFLKWDFEKLRAEYNKKNKKIEAERIFKQKKILEKMKGNNNDENV